jgi:F-type H+-transporting ATPase subunit b
MTRSRRFSTILPMFVMLGFLLSFSANFAQAERGTSTDAKKSEKAGATKDEKLDLKTEFRRSFFGIDPAALSIHTFIVFAILLYVLGKYAWPQIIAGLDKREQTIVDSHESAKLARDEAQKLLAEVQAQRAQTSQEVRSMIEEARKDAQKLKDTLKAEAAAEIQLERDRMKREINIAKDQALQEIYQKTINLAALVSSKAVRRELSAEDHSRLLDESISEISAKLTKA